MILVTIYFMIREFCELVRSGYAYGRDYWNWVNFISIALVLLTGLEYLGGSSLVSNGMEEKLRFQKVVMSAGAFICLAFVGYLKVTFLSFSNFVGGVAQVSKEKRKTIEA
jgi:hypothetical protein